MNPAKILLIDDEPAFRSLCEQWLAQAGYEVRSGASLDEARALLGPFDPDLLLLDLALPPRFDPAETLAAVPEFASRPVIILTGHADRERALQAMEQGAWDFLAKPLDPDMLAVVVKRAVTKHRLSRELQQLRQGQGPGSPLERLIGSSASMSGIRALVERIAPTDARVLVTGPSGTGKEVISRVLHDLSLRAEGPFISVHCGAIPADLLESELFGYVRGAFTGADRDREGLLKLADGGTLFLDEIGEMPLAMQVKLLRVLQEGTFYPVGGRSLQQIDVRVISATNANLPERVAGGEFREDLYYRIKGVTIETRPLAERCEDIPLLVRHFLALQARDSGQPILALEPEVLDWLIHRPWPGNVRELRNTLESICALSRGGRVTPEDVALLHPGVQSGGAGDAGASLDEQVRALEIRLIRQALARHEGNRTHAAATLGVSRQGLLKKIERYGL
ncbi:sigma-54-dependent transcriptional regulator [Marinobacterium aestuariivivens]|uniref:Sigma-54-dependent transcriptional regulator n=1 Tax=Marinobacterium aestuariivivens TaxID=1698799 RepID=A0ABW2A2C8_9GAMM